MIGTQSGTISKNNHINFYLCLPSGQINHMKRATTKAFTQTDDYRRVPSDDKKSIINR